MKLVKKGRKYIVFENDKSDDFDALVWAREILTEISFNMNKNSLLESENCDIVATKQEILYAIELLNLLTDDGRCYIEYEEEN